MYNSIFVSCIFVKFHSTYKVCIFHKHIYILANAKKNNYVHLLKIYNFNLNKVHYAPSYVREVNIYLEKDYFLKENDHENPFFVFHYGQLISSCNFSLNHQTPSLRETYTKMKRTPIIMSHHHYVLHPTIFYPK